MQRFLKGDGDPALAAMAKNTATDMGLRLGAQHWPPGSGDAHRRALLDALGTWNAGAR